MNFSDTTAATILGKAVTQGELAAAFSRVENKSNWKLPVDARVTLKSDAELLTMREAVIFFTGSVPTITVSTFTAEGVVYHIAAAGYYAAVGA